MSKSHRRRPTARKGDTRQLGYQAATLAAELAKLAPEAHDTWLEPIFSEVLGGCRRWDQTTYEWWGEKLDQTKPWRDAIDQLSIGHDIADLTPPDHLMRKALAVILVATWGATVTMQYQIVTLPSGPAAINDLFHRAQGALQAAQS